LYFNMPSNVELQDLTLSVYMRIMRALALGLALAIAPLDGQQASYEDCLRLYRQGSVKEAMAALSAASSNASEFQRTLRDWTVQARRRERRELLEAALMLHTEVMLASAPGGNAWRTQGAIVERLHGALTSFAPRTAFMRQWYLLIDSYRQHTVDVNSDSLDYLRVALEAFPLDAELLLSCGSLHELRWWDNAENVQRDPAADAGEGQQHLRAAADCLRGSLLANPDLLESRLRLGRVLFLLGDLAGADAELQRFRAASRDRGFLYLGRLFEGELAEQRGDRQTADAHYRAAIEIMPAAQSARIAAARLDHVQGRREQAVKMVVRALSEAPDAGDPWGWYVWGQWWQFQNHLATARTMVAR
jgi:tetratricopeptide (TPR) repeat protein